MTSIVRASVLLAALGALAACSPTPAPERAAVTGLSAEGVRNQNARMVAAASALDQRLVRAISAGDLEGVMGTYWRDAALQSFPIDGPPSRGWDGVRGRYARLLAAYPGAQVALIDTHYEVAGDDVIGWGEVDITIPQARGVAARLVGRFTGLYAPRGGRWVRVFEHVSATSPPQRLRYGEAAAHGMLSSSP